MLLTLQWFLASRHHRSGWHRTPPPNWCWSRQVGWSCLYCLLHGGAPSQMIYLRAWTTFKKQANKNHFSSINSSYWSQPIQTDRFICLISQDCWQRNKYFCTLRSTNPEWRIFINSPSPNLKEKKMGRTINPYQHIHDVHLTLEWNSWIAWKYTYSFCIPGKPNGEQLFPKAETVLWYLGFISSSTIFCIHYKIMNSYS